MRSLEQFYKSSPLEMMVRSKHLINAFLLQDDHACTISQAPFLIEAAPVELPSLREHRSVSGHDLKISQ
jgi:hypothetical protein